VGWLRCWPITGQGAQHTANCQQRLANYFWVTPTPAWEIASTCISLDATDQEPIWRVSILWSRPACKAPAMAKWPGQTAPEGQTAEPEGGAPFQASDGIP
jgi:hypothetical protein